MPPTEAERQEAVIADLHTLGYYEDDKPAKLAITRAVQLLKQLRAELALLRQGGAK
jgi:hypothetical protein